MTLRTGVVRRITYSIKYKFMQPGTEKKNDCKKTGNTTGANEKGGQTCKC